MPCPCGTGMPSGACCLPIIEGASLAETAEQLMRSRYTAYALENVDHILQTHDPKNLDEELRAGARRFAAECQFERLEVLSKASGGPNDTEGHVEFKAYFRQNGLPGLLHERSRFRKIDGRWFYVDGTTPAHTAASHSEKIGRNDPCPCGSRKKHKKCCGRSPRSPVDAPK